jgi:dipeptide/tripeptide permease
MKRGAIWLAVGVAALSLIVVGGLAAGFWNSLGASEISLSGWIAMALGVLVSFAVGAGLMALVFYSNRRGYDDINRD